jgi:tetratricopeptide (TPR) repeat protein
MPSNALPTSNPDALRNFVDGNEHFRTYLTSGDGIRLKAARQSFTSAAELDPGFQLAVFYRSLTQSELREADSAISGLSLLLAQGVRFRTEVLIHLAYAHIKRYKDDDYFEAERLLKEAGKDADSGHRRDLRLLIDALTVFLYAVMGGRLSDRDRRPHFLEQSLQLGEGLLRRELNRPSEAGQIEARFEVLNGLGIALMRKAQAAPDVPEKLRYWAEAERRFTAALELRPTAVRAMHNMGSLKGMQALDAPQVDDQAELFKQAKSWLLQSLKLNPNDQFPHYRLSQLLALTSDWQGAEQYYDSGRQQSGAVKEKDWLKLQSAIERRDASDLRWE